MTETIITKQCFNCKQNLLPSCFRTRKEVKCGHSRNCKLCEKKRKDELRITKTCPTCNNNFLANYRKQIYCSVKCYTKLATMNPKWRGGKRLVGGYVYVYCPNHPHVTKAGAVPEHRVIMEEYLGRILSPTEAVHHKNENILDNRISNLELFPTNGHHTCKYHTKRDACGRFASHK